MLNPTLFFFTNLGENCSKFQNWLVVWTPLKNISQLGWLFPIYGKIENVPNHQPENFWPSLRWVLPWFAEVAPLLGEPSPPACRQGWCRLAGCLSSQRKQHETTVSSSIHQNNTKTTTNKCKMHILLDVYIKKCRILWWFMQKSLTN